MPFPIDEKYIVETEKKIGCSLPTRYREKMKKENGGSLELIFEWDLFSIYDYSDKKRIKRTFNNILSETDTAKKWPNFPSNGLVIGRDGCGNFLIFLIEEKFIPDVLYIWNHEYGNLQYKFEDLHNIF